MNRNTIINTYNESSLHQTLKILYATKTNGKTEVHDENYIYDVISEDGTIIEIQTQNISAIKQKIFDSLKEGHKLKLVHPVIITKCIITADSNGNVAGKRKSPKKGSIYDIFRELTGIYPVLLNENFELEILAISMTETRLKSDEKIQSHNRKRKFLKDWIKTNKKLDEILWTKNFSTKEDYLNLLAENILNNPSQEFSSKELKEALQKTPAHTKNDYKKANLILWLFSRMELIEFTRKIGRLNYYRIKDFKTEN